MNMRDAAHNPKTPAWVSAAAAVIVGAIAVWSLASSPSEETLDDHEDRLRVVEQLTARELARINANIEALTREVRMRRGHEPGGQ